MMNKKEYKLMQSKNIMWSKINCNKQCTLKLHEELIKEGNGFDMK